MGVSVTAKAATISAMGMMDVNDSESLDLMRFCNAFLLSQMIEVPYSLIVYYIISKRWFQVLFVDSFKNFYLFLLYYNRWFFNKKRTCRGRCAFFEKLGRRNSMQKAGEAYRRRTKVRQKGRARLKSHTKMEKTTKNIGGFQP